MAGVPIIEVIGLFAVIAGLRLRPWAGFFTRQPLPRTPLLVTALKAAVSWDSAGESAREGVFAVGSDEKRAPDTSEKCSSARGAGEGPFRDAEPVNKLLLQSDRVFSGVPHQSVHVSVHVHIPKPWVSRR
jgi:hypothetical protein